MEFICLIIAMVSGSPLIKEDEYDNGLLREDIAEDIMDWYTVVEKKFYYF